MKNIDLNAERQQELNDILIYEKSDSISISALANGQCAACKRQGFPIFLVRKAIIPKAYNNKDNYWSNKIISLGRREPDANEVSLQTHEYVYRTLRKGYVYILAKRFDGNYEPIGYEVTPSGIFRHKTRYDMKERNIKEIPESCTKEAHRIPGYFINIDTTVYSDTAYVAYTRRAWSDKTIQTYLDMAKDDPKNIHLARFSKIMLTAEGISNSTKLSLEQRSFAFSEFFTPEGPKLLEFELPQEKVYCPNESLSHSSGDNQSETDNTKNDKQFNQALSKNLFITYHPFRSFMTKKNTEKKVEREQIYDHFIDLQGRLISRLIRKENSRDISESVKVAVSALVVEDTFGLAEELSYQRQMKIGPILEFIYNAEQQYTTKMQQEYEKLYLSTASMSEQFEKLKQDYAKSHNEEAKILFDEQYGKTFQTSQVKGYHGQVYTRNKIAEGPINDDFLHEKYYASYDNLVASGVPYRYFNEKLMHMRKHKSYIDCFYNEIAERFSDTGDKVVYDYCKTNYNPEMPVLPTIYPHAATYLREGYIELPIDEKEKRDLLARINDSNLTTEYYDVRKFVLPNSAKAEREKKIAKEIEKYKINLADYRITQFMSEEEKAYNKLIDAIKSHSIDYYIYTTWLFGYSEKGTTSVHTPQAVKTYNQVPFWKIECDSNSSNNHIGYLTDFNNIIGTLSLGNIKLDYQYGLWDILLRDEDTIYFHLINGNPKDNTPTFWSALLNIRQQLDEKYSELKYQVSITGVQPKEDIIDYAARATEAINLLIEQHQHDLDSLFFLEKGAHILNLYQIMISRAVSAVAQREPTTSLINDKLIQAHFLEAAMVIAGVVGKVFSFQVNASQLKSVLRGLGASAKLFTANVLKDTDNKLSLPPITEDLPLSEDKPVVIDYFQIADDTFGLFNDLHMINTVPWAEFKQAKLAGMVHDIKEIWHPTSSSSFKLISSDSVATMLNGISAYSHYMLIAHNYKILDGLGIGQTRQDELKREIVKNFTQLIVKSITIMSDLCSKLKISAFINSFFSLGSVKALLVENVFKSFSSMATVLGVIGPMMSLYDGVMLIVKANTTKDLPSHVRSQYRLCGTLMVISALICLAKIGGILAMLGPAGAVIYFIGIVMGIAVAIYSLLFEDESDKWNRMQTWFNRCLFGLWGHRDKGQPYPPTFEGIAFSANDYFVARLGIDGNVQVYDDCYYVDELMPLEHDQFIEYNESHYQTRASFVKGLYLYLHLPGFDIDNSVYECSVRLQKRCGSRATVNISVTTGKDYPIIQLGEQHQLDQPGASKQTIFVQRDARYLMPISKKDDLNGLAKVKYIEQVGSDPEAVDKGESPHYQIRYKLGEFLSGQMVIRCKLFYYPNGKQTNDGQAVLPLILDYEY
ncbi:hypothetical protein FcAc13_09400 [Frischella sp. Ac13]|uniref:Toxin VasX N-terminal region domain-containing protein n=1 Tax=Frischella japonica TaxID=2741544 RepID=A0ABR7QZL2_9GAMM|nr:toxin VasX [Frischella japonica]MBC9131520.1 hypothetical protein [Frischella japonica]